MEETKLYEKLAEKMDRGVVMGAPKSQDLMGILKIMFPVDDAIIALRLPMENKTLLELKELFPEEADSLEEIMDRMVKNGTVFTSQRPGMERKYRLLPSVVGWAETPYWGGKDTEKARKLSPLWLNYREGVYGEELAREIPAMRAIPISQNVKDSREILPFDALKPLVEKQSFLSVGHCGCRQMKKYTGEGCDHSLENCLHFGSMGRYMVEQDMAREITVEETLQILKEANEEGLVHATDNIDGHMGTICNCCGCCCLFILTRKNRGLNAISGSSFVASVDMDECIGCGTCEERCPMDAIGVNEEDVAEVNEDLCLGCGVCVPSCATEAVILEQRAEINPPPKINEFMAKRVKRV